MKDVTEKYIDMIDSFSCDFNIAISEPYKIDEIKTLILTANKRLFNDIDLLSKLSFELRHNHLKVVEEVKENEDHDKSANEG